jgi:hypothetical protein
MEEVKESKGSTRSETRDGEQRSQWQKRTSLLEGGCCCDVVGNFFF